MSFAVAHLQECERAGDWALVRRTLDVGAFGLNVVEIPPGEQIPEHDELDRDQEEVFFVIDGSCELVIDGERLPLGAGAFARVDPEHKRTVSNDGGDVARVLIASAPRSSGYEPMSWA